MPCDKPEVWYLFRAPYDIEKGVGNLRRRPGYRWVPAYIQAIPGGGTSIAESRSIWRYSARVSKAVCRFFSTEEAARRAMNKAK